MIKILSQGRNTVGEYSNVYVVQTNDIYNKKYCKIEGKTIGNEILCLGIYKDSNQAEYIIKQIYDNKLEVFEMPVDGIIENEEIVY